MKRLVFTAVTGVAVATSLALAAQAGAWRLTPSAAAVTGSTGGVARAIATVPNTNIKGRPAHFSPDRLSARARWVTEPCTASQESFTIANYKDRAKTVVWTGTDHFRSFAGTVPARTRVGVCITKGYSGTLTGTLGGDGRRVTVRF